MSMQQKISRRGALLAMLGAMVLLTPLPTHAAAKKRILMVTHTAGFRHDSIPLAEEVVKALGESPSGGWEVDYARTADDVKTMITAENLRRYDLVFFGNTTAE